MSKFKREEIEKYYEIIGVNHLDNLIISDQMNLSYISDLYELNDLERKVSYTTKDLSDSYALLVQIIKDGFMYPTKKRQETALQASYDIIEDLTKFDIYTDDEETNVERRNNLYTTIIRGLCEVDDIITFRFYQKNGSLNLTYNKIYELEEDNPDDYKVLHYLVAYSKFNDSGLDKDMFDSLNKITIYTLAQMLRTNIYENVSEKEFDTREKEKSKILRLNNYKK